MRPGGHVALDALAVGIAGCGGDSDAPPGSDDRGAGVGALGGAGVETLQNAIVGTKRLGPGGAEAIPPNTAVQKRNPFKEPATFVSWFLVDPKQPFAPKASF